MTAFCENPRKFEKEEGEEIGKMSQVKCQYHWESTAYMIDGRKLVGAKCREQCWGKSVNRTTSDSGT